MRFLLLFLTLLIPVFYIQAEEPSVDIKNIKAAKTAELIQINQNNPDFVIVDLRTPGEYKSGHIPGAVNINFYSDTFEKDLDKLDRSKTYLIYCRSGNRSRNSLEYFRKLKFVYIYHMFDGIISWTGKLDKK